MDPECPTCGAELELVDGNTMTGWERRYVCRECQIAYVRDVGGLLTEVES